MSLRGELSVAGGTWSSDCRNGKRLVGEECVRADNRHDAPPRVSRRGGIGAFLQGAQKGAVKLGLAHRNSASGRFRSVASLRVAGAYGCDACDLGRSSRLQPGDPGMREDECSRVGGIRGRELRREVLNSTGRVLHRRQRRVF